MGIIITVVSALITLILGLIVLLRDTKQVYARAFAAMCIAIVVWVFANHAANDASAELTTINIANKIAFLGGYATVFFGLLFTYYFPVARKVSLSERLIIGMLAVSAFTVSLLESVVGLAVYTSNGVQFVEGEWIALYIMLFMFTLGLICRNLWLSSRRYRNHTEQAQARLILAAFVVSAGLGLLLNVLLPHLTGSWRTTVYGPLSILVLVGVVTYTIVKHRLFDIRLVAVRSMAYILSLGTLALLYASVTYGVAHAIVPGDMVPQWVNVILALFVAFIFQPVTTFFNQFTDQIFYKDSYKSDILYARLNRVLTSTVKLHDVLTRATSVIGSALRPEQISFFIYQANGHPLSVGSKGHLRPTVFDMRQLDGYIAEHSEARILLTEDLPASSGIRRMLTGYRANVALPLLQSNKPIGYLLLGDKRSGAYTSQDVLVLETIADELAIAIQNAASVEEIRDLNANLQQRIDAATEELRASNDQLRSLDIAKDEFVSMASHQLRTPLTSVKGYISMVLEGDGGRITKQQKHLLSEAFASSERMVHLINDFLNVSRVQTGKFMIERHEVDLVQVVRQEVDLLKRTAETRDLRLKLDVPSSPVRLQVDEGKIRQVLMNFIDNAIYYSRPDTDVVVSLKVSAKEVRVEVIDHGIGVPAAQQSGLFTKFFRADNARTQRPDGTGVGLYLAKMVIDGHDGKVIFSSREGKGSTFGFRLPLTASTGKNTGDTHN